MGTPSTAAEATGALLRFNRVYILPSRHGLGFAAAVCVMLLGAINYGNALGYALCFLLIATGLVSMLHAVRNLAGLRLSALPTAPVFAGDRARFRLGVREEGGRRRYALAASVAPAEGRAPGDRSVVGFSLEAGGAHTMELPVPARRRGWYRPGRALLATRFPFGWFRAWSRTDAGLGCLVYPRPEGHRPLPLHLPEQAGEHGTSGRGDDEFAGLREYQQGDPARRIHWKAVAREQSVPVKVFGGASAGLARLRWEDAAGDTEARLSQLCRWVLDADAAGLRYGLALPGVEIPPGDGDAHRERCLEALALYEEARYG